MTGAGVPVVAPRVIVALMTLSSAIVRAADISVKADKHTAEFDGKTWDDYEQRLFAHLDARGLLDVHVQAVRGSLTVISNGTPEEKALYPSLSPVGRRSLVMVYDVRATRMREDDYPAGSQWFEDIGIGGSGGVARNLFDSPAARELRDVLGGDAMCKWEPSTCTRRLRPRRLWTSPTEWTRHGHRLWTPTPTRSSSRSGWQSLSACTAS